MNATYFKFLFVTTIKKRPVWITWLIFLLAISAFIILLPAVSGANTLQVWANTAMTICESFVGMAAALFTAILGIHTFKDGLEDGTELIVISKPISRRKLVLTKFCVFGVMCLIVNLSAVFITLFTILLPTTEVKFYWQLVLSMFIGNLVAFAVFGSIACLLTLKFAKVGVIVVNVIISLIIIIYQCLTLFCFSTPAKSLLDHGMKAPSYILIDRDMKTGAYKEDEVVRFDTLSTNTYLTIDKDGHVIRNDHANTAIDWQGMSDYWTKEILKNNPSKWLSWTDLGSQLALTYLSGGLGEYAHRQANRAFALSRYYDYKLTSPASPEITSGVNNKKSLSWAYTGFTLDELYDGSYFLRPTYVTFPGIAPLGSTRLRGYGDKIPVGHYVKAGEILATKDIHFEQDEWKKYIPYFDVIYNNIFDHTLYTEFEIPEENPELYASRPAWWSTTNPNQTRYYQLMWACFTGNAGELEYAPGTPLADLTKENFDVKTVDDINERFIQFKYYAALKAIEAQKNLLMATPQGDEATYKNDVLADPDYKDLMSLLGIKALNNSWLSQTDTESNAIIPFVQPDTTVPFFDLIRQTSNTWAQKIAKDPEGKWKDAIADTTYAKLLKTASIISNCSETREEFMFDSMDKPTRSSSHRGTTYIVSNGWYSNIETVVSVLGINGERCVGQNMQWFFYETKDTINFLTYTLIWLGISIGLFTAAAITYNKYDVK